LRELVAGTRTFCRGARGDGSPLRPAPVGRIAAAASTRSPKGLKDRDGPPRRLAAREKLEMVGKRGTAVP